MRPSLFSLLHPKWAPVSATHCNVCHAGFSQMLPSLLPHMNSQQELEKLKGMMVRPAAAASPSLIRSCHVPC